MKPGFRFNDPGYFARIEFKGHSFKFGVQFATAAQADISALPGRSGIFGIQHRQSLEALAFENPIAVAVQTLAYLKLLR